MFVASIFTTVNKQPQGREEAPERMKRDGGGEEINSMEMGDQRRPPTTSCIMQQKKEMMFVSDYFLIFIRYIFQLNWNLSGHIGREWHHSSSWTVFPWLMGCNKMRRGGEGGKEEGSLLHSAE